MQRAATHILLLAALPAFAQSPDLTPLLPPGAPISPGIRAILRNDPTAAIRILRHSGEPKALGVAYYQARQYLLFRDQMAAAIARDPTDFGPYYYLGRHYDTDLDNCEEAAGWLRKAIDRNPSYPRARAYLGSCLERLGQTQEAETQYRASISLPLSQLGMARLKFAAGETGAALSWAEKAISADPRDASAQRFAARLYETLGRPGDAILALEAAARAAPYDASIHYVLARLLRSTSDPAKAAAALREFERLRDIYGSQPQ